MCMSLFTLLSSVIFCQNLALQTGSTRSLTRALSNLVIFFQSAGQRAVTISPDVSSTMDLWKPEQNTGT
jgi:hypothetical protein